MQKAVVLIEEAIGAENMDEKIELPQSNPNLQEVSAAPPIVVSSTTNTALRKVSLKKKKHHINDLTTLESLILSIGTPTAAVFSAIYAITCYTVYIKLKRINRLEPAQFYAEWIISLMGSGMLFGILPPKQTVASACSRLLVNGLSFLSALRTMTVNAYERLFPNSAKNAISSVLLPVPFCMALYMTCTDKGEQCELYQGHTALGWCLKYNLFMGLLRNPTVPFSTLYNNSNGEQCYGIHSLIIVTVAFHDSTNVGTLVTK